MWPGGGFRLLSDATVLSLSPHIILLRDFISEEERLHLLSLPEFHPSTVVDAETGISKVSPYRTGDMAMLKAKQDLVVREIENRVAAVTYTRPEQGEPLQIVRYKRGQRYKPHNDWFDRVPQNAPILAQGGQRIKTLMIYLQCPKSGGATEFTQLGIKVKPELRAALMWDNLLPDGQEDQRLMHRGAPVGKGVKIIATRWIRQRAWDGSENDLTPEQMDEKLCSESIRAALKRYKCVVRAVPRILNGKVVAEPRVFSAVTSAV